MQHGGESMGREQRTLTGSGKTGPHTNAGPAPHRPHHTRAGFRNLYGQEPPRFRNVLRWQLERLLRRRPAPPTAAVEPVAWSEQSPPTAGAAVSWLGHATLLVQFPGVVVVTDPVFDARVSPLPWIGPARHRPPPVRPIDLPHVDVVVISHNHYDHLSLDAMRTLHGQPGGPPLFLVPLGLEHWFARRVGTGEPSRVRAMDWWDATTHNGVGFTFLPVQHWSSRSPWDRNTTLWGAWAVHGPGLSFFFAGDLGYSRDVRDIGEHIGGFDLAAIPIGAYDPRWLMRPYHLTADDAVRVHRDIGARRSLGIHWGTYENLTDEPLDEPPRELARACAEAGLDADEFFVLKPGETWLAEDP